MRHFRRLAICLALLGACLLCACGAASPEAPSAPASEYTIRYYDGSTLLREVVVPAGGTPEAFSPAIDGRRFVAWQTAKGERVEPSAEAAARDVSYTAYTLPLLRMHTPYLFPDENNFIHPYDALSVDALALAAAALGADTAGLKLTDGEQPVTAAELKSVLSAYFTEDELSILAAFESISRADFARVMNGLLGQGGQESVQAADGALAPVDLAADDPLCADVLEACVPHEPGGELGWESLALGTGYEPGALFMNGELYWCGEDGRLVRGTVVEPLRFGADGRYTSGDAELDGYVTEILASFCAAHPEEARDREALLRRAYDYAMANFHYVGRSSHTDEEGWELRDGKLMLETGRGDCYDYTAGFVVLARGLGYPAYGIIRSLDSPENLHAWTDIVIDGTAYIFDPQLEKHFHNSRFMLTYKQGAKYGYRRPFDTPGKVIEAAEDLVWVQPTQRGELISATGENGLIYLVYLPYGYDAGKQYNVLIYPYGADGDPYKMLGTANTYSHQNRYFGRYITTPAYIDYLVERGDCNGLIFAATNTARADGQSDRYISLLQYVADNFSTYAASSSIEDLIAARDHFGIAGPSTASQSICVSLKDMPDVFGYIGLFSGISRLDEAVEAMAQKRHICLVMGVGDRESILSSVKMAYERFSELENVDASLTIFPNSEHEWSAFDGALRELLFKFSPKSK